VYIIRKSTVKNGTPINLLVLHNPKTGENHYCLITSLSRLVHSSITKHTKKLHFCFNCLAHFHSQQRLYEHKEICEKFPLQTISLPSKPYNFAKFDRFHCLERVGFVLYADFETTQSPYLDEYKTLKGENEKIMNVISYAYIVQRADGYLYKLQNYAGPDAMQHFLSALEAEEAAMLSYVETYNKDNSLHIDYSPSSQYCWVCRKPILPLDARCLDHSHITHEVRGYAHARCNTKLKLRKLLVVVFHGGVNFDQHFVVRHLKGYKKKLFIIPKSNQRYLSLSMNRTRLIDSFQFLSASLNDLITNITKNGVSELKVLNKFFSSTQLNLVLSKLPFPYEFMTSLSCLEAKILPEIAYFKDILKGGEISDAEYLRAKKIWEIFDCQTFKDFLLIYNSLDVLQLVEIITKFRNISIAKYELDPMHFLSLPGYAWSSFLRFANVKIELITEIDMFLFFEDSIRGGMVDATIRYVKANNKYLPTFDATKESVFCLYIDYNSLYPSAACECLPIGQFSWLNASEIRDLETNLLNISSTASEGYYLEVDLVIPENKHNYFNWYPLAPEKIFHPDEMLSPYIKRLKKKFDIKRGKVKKLVASLEPKIKYKLHYRLLQLYVELGAQITKIHRVLKFRQAPFMKSFILDTINQRQNSANTFEKNFYKLIANSIYGNCARNKRKEHYVRLVTNMDVARRVNKNPLLKSFNIYEKDLVAAELRKKILHMDRPVQVAASILDLSKMIMFHFYYKILKSIYPKPNQLKMSYHDTDSQLVIIRTADLYDDLLKHKHLFDFSNYPTSHPCYDLTNKLKLNCMKDEMAGAVISEAVFLRPKVYSIQVHEAENIKKAKGLPKKTVKLFRHNDYKKALFCETLKQEKFHRIHARSHKVFLRKEMKIGISAYADKRYYFGKCGILSYAYGHKNIKVKRSAPVRA
jgi:hypothetical protein